MRLFAIAFLTALLIPVAASGQQCSTAPGPTAPLAVDDQVYVSSIGVGVGVPVLANDVVAEDGSLSIVNVSIPTRGTAVKNADNTITYTPGSLGDDTFTYTIIDTTQSTAPSATGTVHVNVRSGFEIVADCTGGDCLFDAFPPRDGLKSVTWNYGDGSPVFKASTRAFHTYPAAGSYTVSARADYYSGEFKDGTLGITIIYQKNLEWTVTVDGLGASILVDYESLLTFPGGALAAGLHVKFGDNADDCVYLCRTGTGFSCWPYCQPVGDAYYRSGTYPIRLTLTDGNGATYNYAKYVTAVNAPPVPDFSFTRDEPGRWSFTFDPSLSTDDFDIHSDPRFAPGPYEWDFGDGMTAVTTGPTTVNHVYANAGQYAITLRLTDPGGEVGYKTKTVTVVNEPPVPKITVNCRVLDCTFGVEGSVDDGDAIQTWQWDFGDTTTASGPSSSKHYTAAACYLVTLRATDSAGKTGTATLTVPVGPPLTPAAGGVVADAHVQSFGQGQSKLTSNGNLNGIFEPGETAVIEPRWTAAASTQPVMVNSSGWTSTDWYYANPAFRDFVSSYDLSTGTSDCWTSGRCYVVELRSTPSSRNANQLHNDISFNETYVSNGQPTPGSPITIHVGSSFTDVAATHWAYPFIESILHAGIDTGCGGLQYCPNTAVTRAQIAQPLLKAKYGSAYAPPACTTDPFTDVPCSRPEAGWIAQLKAEGITTGTGNGAYSPDAGLTRAEMAVFVLRTKLGGTYTPPACEWDFGDAPCPNHWASAWISDVKRRGISAGCVANEYCPEDGVDRAQAASFLTKAFGLNLAAKQCESSPYDTVQGHQPRPPIVSLTFDPSPVFIGTTSVGTLTLGLATPNGVQVPLSIDNPSAASIPSSVFVPPGVFSATFIATPANVSVRTPTNITAAYLGTTKTTRLDVCTPAPAISVQPASHAIYYGQSTSLSVTASGGGALTYQWYEGAAPSTAKPIGTNSNVLNITPQVTTSYWVNVSNACASTASNTATVTVCHPPTIAAQPLNDVIVTGTSATLSVTAGGSGPFSYQWYEGASGTTTTPVGTNSSTFTTPALTANKSYWVRVTSTCNGPATASSATATITVVSSITRRQTSGSAVNSLTSITTNWTRPTQAGSLLVAAVSASHNGTQVGAINAPAGWQVATSYEWTYVKTTIYYYPNNPGGRTAETFTTATATSFRDLTLQLAEYVAAVAASPLDRTAFNGDHQTTGDLVSTGNTQTTVQPKELLISALAINTATNFSSPDNLFVEIQDHAAGNTLTGAMHERIVSGAGSYGHQATVYQGPGGTTQWVGAIATFKSIDPAAACTTAPSITVQPVSKTITPGGTATLSVTASGQGILTYQWYQGTAPSTTTPVGTNSSTLNVSPATTTNYWVSVSNACGSTASTTATVTVCTPVSITAQPASRTINNGASTTLTVTATGSAPLSYQWYQGTAPSTTTPAGTNSNSLTVTPAATTNYWVRVSNACSNVASTTATVTVCNAPAIAAQPQSQSITSGATATLTVTPGGSGPFSYQWYEGASGTTTTPVGTNNASYTTPALTANKSYWVRVTSTCNGSASVNSNTATITVTAISQITRRQTASNAVNSLTSITTNWTQPTQGGSLLVAVIAASSVAYPIGNFTTPAGWQHAVTYEWNNVKTSIYYYPNNPGGRTSETFTIGKYQDQVLALAEYTGIATTSPLDRTAFDGDHTSSGTVSTGTTQTYQAKELIVTALAINTATEFWSPDNLFVELHDRAAGNTLTMAMHERIVSGTGVYGHTASVGQGPGGSTQWVGAVATFKAAN